MRLPQDPSRWHRHVAVRWPSIPADLTGISEFPFIHVHKDDAMSNQNLATLSLSEAQLQAIDQALTDLEQHLAQLTSLDAAHRRKLLRMGDKSESFCRQTLNLLIQNPQVVPPSMDLAGAIADLQALDRLRPRLLRLQRLAERGSDTQAALGSDVMRCALDGYTLLKVAGRNQGLDALRRELGARFAKSPRPQAPNVDPDAL